MNNKTCGECRYYVEDFNLCLHWRHEHITESSGSCNYFAPLTNGDVIRQGGNRDFAEYFVYETGAVFASTLIVDKTFDTYEEAVKATEDYLNAPAESEGGNEKTY